MPTRHHGPIDGGRVERISIACNQDVRACPCGRRKLRRRKRIARIGDGQVSEITAVERRAAAHHVILAKTRNHHIIAWTGFDIVHASLGRGLACTGPDQNQIRLPTAGGRRRRIEIFTTAVDVAIHQEPKISGAPIRPELPAAPIACIEIGIDGFALQHRRINPGTGIERAIRVEGKSCVAKDQIIALTTEEHVITRAAGDDIRAKAAGIMRRISMEENIADQTTRRICLRRGTTHLHKARINLLGADADQTMAAQDHIIASACVDHIVAVSERKTRGGETRGIDEMPTNQIIITLTTADHIRALTTDDQITARATQQTVIPAFRSSGEDGMKRQGSVLHRQDLARGKATDLRVIAKEDVLTAARADPVSTIAAEQNVIATPGGDHIRPA